MPYKPAEPTIDRLERYYAIIHDVEEASRVDAPAAKPKPAMENVSLSDLADEMQARSQALPLVLDAQRVIQEMWATGRFRQIAAIVMVKDDGSDVSEDEAGRIRPSAIGSAVVPFSRELALSWSMLNAGAGDGASATPDLVVETLV